MPTAVKEDGVAIGVDEKLNRKSGIAGRSDGDRAS